MNTRLVTINYFSADRTHKFVKSAIAAGLSSEEIVVYDNSGDYVQIYSENVIISKYNYGIGPIWAREIKHWNNKEQTLILSNNDVELPTCFFKNLNEIDNQHTIVGPQIYVGDRVWSSGGSFSKIFKWKINHENSKKNDIYRTEHLSGCFLILRPSNHDKDLLTKGLNSYFFRGEEWQFAHNCLEGGIPLFVVPTLEIKHDENGSHDRFSDLHVYYAVRAKILFCKMNFKTSINSLTYMVYISSVGIVKYSRLSKRPIKDLLRPIFRGIFDGVKSQSIKYNDY